MPKLSFRNLLLIVLAVIWTAYASAQTGPGGPSALQAKYQELQDRLANNTFGRPVWLDSKQTSDAVEGEVYSVISYPFMTVKNALGQPDNWCEILFLHLNVKYCKATQDGGGNLLTLYAGKKQFQELSSAYRIDYRFRTVDASNNYQQIIMTADNGPYGTSDYRIMLEAIPLDRGTFIHVKYSYSYGTMAKLAMRSYLGTLGSGKVGFSVEGKDESGNPTYVTGLRGAIERNTMRYYLAIDAYLKSLGMPEGERLEGRLREWFRSTERYSKQLHELSQNEYLAMKRKEYERMRSGSQ